MKKADLIVANSESCADLLYASGFMAPDDFIYFATAEECAVVVSVLEYDRARSQVKPGVKVYEYGEFAAQPGTRTPELLQAIAAAKNIGKFRIPAYFPVRLAAHLRRAGIALDIAEGAFLPERQCKDEAEIAHIAASLRMAEQAMRRGWEVLGAASVAAGGRLVWEGEALSAERLRMEVNVAMIRAGGIGVGTITAGGTDGAQPHNAGSGQLYAHTPIVMDLFPRSQTTGYWGDLTRTVVKGKASAVVRRAFDAVRDARDRAIGQLAPGADGKSIHEQAARLLAERGFPTGIDAEGRRYGFIHGLGHGVGLEIHEAPRLNSVPGLPLVSGAVVTVEPGVYDPAWGGMRLEDLVAITASGHRNLTGIETVLELE